MEQVRSGVPVTPQQGLDWLNQAMPQGMPSQGMSGQTQAQFQPGQGASGTPNPYSPYSPAQSGLGMMLDRLGQGGQGGGK